MVFTPAPGQREAYIAHRIKPWKILWGSLPFEEEDIRGRSAMEFDRSYYPQGIARQLMATLAHGNRKSRLAGNRPVEDMRGTCLGAATTPDVASDR